MFTSDQIRWKVYRQEVPKLGAGWLVTSIPDEGKTAPGPTSDNIVART